ncbi:MAG: DUF6560 family protein [Clostridia bacterium]
MKHHPITEQEKQLSAIRMPKKYLALFFLDLFAFLLIAFLTAGQNSAVGIVIIGLIFLSPMIVLLFAYFNYIVYFDRKQIIYRSFTGKIHRYHYEDIQSVSDEGVTIDLICADKKKIRLFREDPQTERLLRLTTKFSGIKK